MSAPLALKLDQLRYTAKKFKQLTEFQKSVEIDSHDKILYPLFIKDPKVTIVTES